MLLKENVLITLDVDWAPDFAIDFVTRELISHNVKATWFVTHSSPAITRLRQYPELFELGIHPNFLPGSTHGKNPESVLRHCLDLAPDALSMRTHGLFQSTPLLELVLTQTRIRADVSLFLPRMPFLRPFEYRWHGCTMMRIPFYWEDDYEMEQVAPCWHLKPLHADAGSIMVFNFHPLHVYLNSADLKPYDGVKRLAPRLTDVTEITAEPWIHQGKGTRTVFTETVSHLSCNQRSLNIRDIYLWWESSKQ